MDQLSQSMKESMEQIKLQIKSEGVSYCTGLLRKLEDNNFYNRFFAK